MDERPKSNRVERANASGEYLVLFALWQAS